jgi:hypothetical protein
MTVKNVVKQCASRKSFRDLKVAKKISGKQLHRMYSFLISILQIMDDVELSLQPAPEEVVPDACTPAKKVKHEESRV